MIGVFFLPDFLKPRSGQFFHVSTFDLTLSAFAENSNKSRKLGSVQLRYQSAHTDRLVNFRAIMKGISKIKSRLDI